MKVSSTQNYFSAAQFTTVPEFWGVLYVCISRSIPSIYRFPKRQCWWQFTLPWAIRAPIEGGGGRTMVAIGLLATLPSSTYLMCVIKNSKNCFVFVGVRKKWCGSKSVQKNKSCKTKTETTAKNCVTLWRKELMQLVSFFCASPGLWEGSSQSTCANGRRHIMYHRAAKHTALCKSKRERQGATAGDSITFKHLLEVQQCNAVVAQKNSHHGGYDGKLCCVCTH